jgi:hypothetical protein
MEFVHRITRNAGEQDQAELARVGIEIRLDWSQRFAEAQ